MSVTDPSCIPLIAGVVGVGAVTVMVVDAVRVLVAKPVPEPVAVTVMVAMPGATPNTCPVPDTVATAGVELV